MKNYDDYMKHSKRFKILKKRNINKDTYIHKWYELGLSAEESVNDPEPSLSVKDGKIIEMDGKTEEEFDIVDRFISNYSINLGISDEAMSLDSLQAAKMLVDIYTPREKLAQLFTGMTPAKIVDIVKNLNVVEMMMALQKMRVRRTPANQAHVTNLKENPVLLAADASESALRGFSEIETTVGVSRCAPLNALSVLIGSQTGKGGALTQCAVEEELGLKLAMRGFTSYAETLSIYGTEQALIDGDDTPWSKAFLASAYASRGIKVRFTSGTGSEALMGHSEGKSMLYLEARCLVAARGAGTQGIQNGSISCVALPESLPGGVKVILAENLIASMLGMEVASGNDAMSSHSDIRKTAKLMLQFLPGTDFICSGYSAVPRKDNLFGGGNFDSDDFDDYLILQRDMQVNGGLVPVKENDVIKVRRHAAEAIKAVLEELNILEITDNEIEIAVYAHSSDDIPEHNITAYIDAADELMKRNITGLDIVKLLQKRGFSEIAENILKILKQRISGDYLQTSAIINSDFIVKSGINDPNDYAGPGTGYRLNDDHWEKISDIPQAQSPEQFLKEIQKSDILKNPIKAEPGKNKDEVVIAVAPAFGSIISKTITGLSHKDVLHEIAMGIKDEGLIPRIIKFYHTSDCASIGHTGAVYSGSGIAVGIQSKGTAVIHRKDLQLLNNLELFSQAPNLTLKSYRAIGRNAAKYARGIKVSPVPVKIDNMARLKFITKTTIMHHIETIAINKKRKPEAFKVLL